MCDPSDDTDSLRGGASDDHHYGQKDPRRALLPAPIGVCSNGYTPETVRKDRRGRVLVHERRATVEASVHAVRAVDGAQTQALKGCVVACECEHPPTPSVRLLKDVLAAGTVLELLRTTRVGCIGVGRVPPEDGGEDTEGDEGGSAPP